MATRPTTAQLDLAPENLAITTLFTDVPVGLPVGGDLTVLVASRVAFTAPLVAPFDGSLRVEGTGAAAVIGDDEVRLDLQANGGFMVSLLVDPVPSGVSSSPLPELTGWVPPDGYRVRDGDTAADLGELFLGDPDRFAELSDHDPVPGEVLTLPATAVPGWLVLATAPPLPEPETQLWVQFVPDDLLRVLYTDADPTPLHDLSALLDRPPTPGPDPAAEMASRLEALTALDDPDVVLGPEPDPVEAF